MNISMEQAMNAEAGLKANMSFLPLLKQPTIVELKKLPKQSRTPNQRKPDYAAATAPKCGRVVLRS